MTQCPWCGPGTNNLTTDTTAWYGDVYASSVRCLSCACKGPWAKAATPEEAERRAWVVWGRRHPDTLGDELPPERPRDIPSEATMTALQRLALYHGIVPDTASMRRTDAYWWVRGTSMRSGLTSARLDLDWHNPYTTEENAAAIALDVQATKDAGEAKFYRSEAARAEACAAKYSGPWHLLVEYNRLMAQALAARLLILNPTKTQETT